MLPTTILSELEAVNVILQIDGETPVTSLDEIEEGFSEAASAQSYLRRASMTLQSEGWNFNTDRARRFTPGVSKEIELPSDVLSVAATSRSYGRPIVERGRRLYDNEENTYQFDGPVYLDVVNFLAFEELPVPFRLWVSINAARAYQADATGSVTQDNFTEDDLVKAMTTAKKVDSRMRRSGHFRNPRHNQARRRRP